MKKIPMLFLIAIAVSLLNLGSADVAKAAVSTETGILNPDWTPWPSVSGSEVEFEARIGNGALGGSWELGHKFDGTYLDTSGQFAITNGADIDFTLTHDAASGDFILSLAGGPSTTWASGHPGEAVQEIWLLAKTSNTAYTSSVKNLALDGSSLGTNLVATNNKTYLKISGEPISDFSLQGTMNFSWSSGTPTDSHIETMISVTSFVPIPPNGPVLLESFQGTFENIQDAYARCVYNAQSADTIKVKAGDQQIPAYIDLWFDGDVSIKLEGGYDDTFTNIISATEYFGSLTISGGSVTVSNLIIK